MQNKYKFLDDGENRGGTFLLSDLIPFLKDGNLRVNFVKTNGERRSMLCTLKDEVLPPMKEAKPVEFNENTPIGSMANLPVWDVDKSDWRSFRLDSVISFEQA